MNQLFNMKILIKFKIKKLYFFIYIYYIIAFKYTIIRNYLILIFNLTHISIN
jgi:hypothetical protein